MRMVKKFAWVQIHKIILKPEERSQNLPEDTKMVPLEMWVKGYLLEDACINDVVKIKTTTGRIEIGVLIQENPSYMHTYGNFVPEILKIDQIVKSAFSEGDADE